MALVPAARARASHPAALAGELQASLAAHRARSDPSEHDPYFHLLQRAVDYLHHKGGQRRLPPGSPPCQDAVAAAAAAAATAPAHLPPAPAPPPLQSRPAPRPSCLSA